MIEIDNNKMWEAIEKLLDVADAIKVSLSKQGLQWNGKEIVNIKPKFKVGDWIVGANNVFKIIALNNKLNCYIAITQNNEKAAKIPYYFDDGQGHMCSYHLWTIQDAKDGDILVSGKEKRPFIFKGLLDELHPNNPVAYCGIDYGDRFIVTAGTSWWTDKEIEPATKEQYDLLFSKMKEADYVWLSGEKKLVKLLFKEGDTVRKKLDGSIWHINYINENGYLDHHKPLFPIENQNEFELVKPELTSSEVTKENNELTEFEETLFKIVNSYKGKEMHTEGAKAWAKELLSIARKQFIEEACDWLKYTEIGAFPYKLIEEFRKDLGEG